MALPTKAMTILALRQLEKRKKKKAPRIVYGSTKKSAWTKPIHNKDDSDEDANKSEGESEDEINQ